MGQNAAGQRRTIARWLEGNGIDAAHVPWYLDKAGGDHLDRPGFEQLQAAIFRGEIGTVVIWRLDRLHKPSSQAYQRKSTQTVRSSVTSSIKREFNRGACRTRTVWSTC